MKKITLKASNRNCQIVIGEGMTQLPAYAKATKVVIITDRNVRRLYGSKFDNYKIIEIGMGEESKTLETVSEIYDKMLELEIERDSFVVGIGGGIVCDITGFVAATYLRGINFGFVPTTLLAQVDAGIGGKNGVNLKGYKNLIGTIKQPNFCLCDLDVLKTLPKEELHCGFAEVIKHGAIANVHLFEYLEQNCEMALCLDEKIMEKIIEDSIMVKVGIVSTDETEKNERMKLNFGHTFAHALEKVEKITHGQAVAIGMVIAAEISVKRGLLNDTDRERILKLIEKFELPTERKLKSDEIIDAIRKDKKRNGEEIKMVLLEGIGRAKIWGVGLDELENTIKNMC